MKKLFIFVMTLALLTSCYPTLRYYSWNPSRESKPDAAPIELITQIDKLPANSYSLGVLEISLSGENYIGRPTRDSFMEMAKGKARRVGGDAIYVMEFQEPDSLNKYYKLKAAILVLKDISNWPKLTLSEEDARKYVESNLSNLNQIEGIWNVSDEGEWKNTYTGQVTSANSINAYRIAIIRSSSELKYDFVAIVLESSYRGWNPGFIKAKIRKTAYESVYEVLWYMKDFSEKKENFVISEDGTIENRSKEIFNFFEINNISKYIKAFPPIGKSLPISEKDRQKYMGSCFLLTKEGLVLTSYHIVRNSKKIEVVFPQKNISKEAIIKIQDSQNDIAILELRNFDFSELFNESIPYSIGDISLAKIGQEIFTLGFPLGDAMGTRPRLSTGKIDSLFGLRDDPRHFQISNPLQPGNNGGPLFNNKGELVGIVVSGLDAKYLYENYGIIPQNVNFAIKISFVKNLLDLLPESQIIMGRKNLLSGLSLEKQVEKIMPFVLRINSY
jgi:serine protease Do